MLLEWRDLTESSSSACCTLHGEPWAVMPVQGLILTLGEESALSETCHLYPSRALVFHIGKALYGKKEPLQLTH